MIPASIEKKPDYRAEAEGMWHEAEACMEGGRGLRKAALSAPNGGVFLPREYRETDYRYQARVNDAKLPYNPYRQAVIKEAGLLLENGITLGAYVASAGGELRNGANDMAFDFLDDVPECVKELWEDVDRQGTHGDVFIAKIVMDALVCGDACVLVDFYSARSLREKKKADGEEWTQADDVDAGVRPYFVRIPLANIIDAVPGEFVRYRDDLVERDPKDEFAMTTRKRVRVIEPGRYRIAEYGTNGWDWVEEGIMPDIMPVDGLPFRPYTDTSWLCGKPLHDEAIEATIQLFNRQAMMAVVQKKTGFYSVFAKRLGKKRVMNADGSESEAAPDIYDVLAPFSFVNANDPDADMKVVESSGMAIEAMRNVLKDTIEDADRASVAPNTALLTNVGETKAMIDASNARSPLNGRVRAIEDMLERLFAHVKRWSDLTGWRADEFKVRVDGGSVFLGKPPSKVKQDDAPVGSAVFQEE